MAANVTFNEFTCTVRVGYYSNGRKALQLLNVDGGTPVAVATINLPDTPLQLGEVIIKDYSENEGMVEALVVAKIIEYPHREVTIDYGTHSLSHPICKLLQS